jgi:predicted nuclease with RNAse H fold
MNKPSQVNPAAGLHLVQPTDKVPAPSQQEVDSFIAEGVRTYERLVEELLHGVLPRDLEKMVSLIVQQRKLREQLAAYGVRVI